MPLWVHRTTKAPLFSQPEDELPEPVANYIKAPDLSAVLTGGEPKYWPHRYWLINGDDTISLMGQAARDAVDAQLLDVQRDSSTSIFDEPEDVIRALGLSLLSELNLLRAQHGLSARTPAQLKAAIRAQLGV